MHQDDQRFALFIFENQCFDDSMFVDVEFAGGNAGATMLFVIVKMVGKGDFVRFEKLGCLGFGSVVVFDHQRAFVNREAKAVNSMPEIVCQFFRYDKF